MTTGSPLSRLVRSAFALASAFALLALSGASASAQSLNPCAIRVNCIPQQVGPAPTISVAQPIPLVNGGFEDTAGGISPVSAMIQQHGWVRGGAEVFVTSRARCGTHSMESGGHMGGNGFMYTQVNIPTGAVAPVLIFNLYAQSAVTGTSVVDRLNVYVMPGTADMIWNDPTRIDPATGHTVGTPLAVYSNLDTTNGAWVGKTISLPTTLGGLPIAGQSIQLWFVTEINSQVPLQGNNFMPITTDYWLDQVSLWTSTPYLMLVC
jgi:hypothetical protein